VMEHQRILYAAPALPLVPFPFPATLPQNPHRYLLFLFTSSFLPLFSP
jgi:hypothetical protein